MYDLILRHPFLSFAVAWVVVFVGTGVASYLTAPGGTLPQPPFGSGRPGQVAPDPGESAQEAVAGTDSGVDALDRPQPGPAPAPPANPTDEPDGSRAVVDAGSATESGAGPAGELAPAVKGTRTPPHTDTAGQSAASPDEERSTPGASDSTTKPEENKSSPASTESNPSPSPESTTTTVPSEPPTSESPTAESADSPSSTSTEASSRAEEAPAGTG